MKPKRKKSSCVIFRVDDASKKKLSLYCVEHETSFQKLFEDYVIYKLDKFARENV